MASDFGVFVFLAERVRGLMAKIISMIATTTDTKYITTTAIKKLFIVMLVN
jgi:hypothetical protein